MKREDFIVGRWYYRTVSKSIIKFKDIKDSGVIISSESLTGGTYYEYRELGWGTNVSEFSLLEDLSKIQKYLPDGHPDKTISYEIY